MSQHITAQHNTSQYMYTTTCWVKVVIVDRGIQGHAVPDEITQELGHITSLGMVIQQNYSCFSKPTYL